MSSTTPKKVRVPDLIMSFAHVAKYEVQHWKPRVIVLGKRNRDREGTRNLTELKLYEMGTNRILPHPFLAMSDLYLVSRKTALVAIDLQNAIMGISAAPYPATQVVQRNRKIADELRARGGLVVWVRVNLKQFIQLPVDEPSPLAGKPLPDELSEIVRSAGFQDGDLLVTKRHWGAFAGTSLEPELRSRGIDTVVLTGISTNGGVESTLRQGTGLGFAFVVVEDACSGQDAEEHRFAFERIFPRLARVRTVEEVLKALA
jgi:nicotinamidase-related amidase